MKEAVALKGKWRVVALLLLCGLLQGCGLLPPPEGQPELSLIHISEPTRP